MWRTNPGHVCVLCLERHPSGSRSGCPHCLHPKCQIIEKFMKSLCTKKRSPLVTLRHIDAPLPPSSVSPPPPTPQSARLLAQFVFIHLVGALAVPSNSNRLGRARLLDLVHLGLLGKQQLSHHATTVLILGPSCCALTFATCRNAFVVV